MLFMLLSMCVFSHDVHDETKKNLNTTGLSQNHSYLTLHGGVPARTVGQEQRRKTRGPEREAESLLTDTMVTKQ